jgi:outer membrane protein TolC
LPAIRLSGRGSTVSDQLSELISDPTSVLWNVAASVSQPVFQGGELTARARQALARNEVAVEFFMELALQAFREVESTLAREHSLVAQQVFLDTELAQAKLAESQASRDYSEGIVGILEVLEAQRRAFNARNSMISLQNERLQNRIDIHLALGGDFETPISNDAENLLENDGKPGLSLNE